MQGKAGWWIAGQNGLTGRLQQLVNVFRGPAENGGAAPYDDRTLDQDRLRRHGLQQLAAGTLGTGGIECGVGGFLAADELGRFEAELIGECLEFGSRGGWARYSITSGVTPASSRIDSVWRLLEHPGLW